MNHQRIPNRLLVALAVFQMLIFCRQVSLAHTRVEARNLPEKEEHSLCRNLPGVTNIYNADQLRAIESDLTGKYQLCVDIDLAGAAFKPIGCKVEESPCEEFSGELDGREHTIKNFSITPFKVRIFETFVISYAGLFGRIAGGRVKQLVIENASVSVVGADGRTHRTLSGLLAASIDSATISDISIRKSSAIASGIDADHCVGLFACSVNSSTLHRLVIRGNVTGSSGCYRGSSGGLAPQGGLAGTISNSTVKDSQIFAAIQTYYFPVEDLMSGCVHLVDKGSMVQRLRVSCRK